VRASAPGSASPLLRQFCHNASAFARLKHARRKSMLRLSLSLGVRAIFAYRSLLSFINIHMPFIGHYAILVGSLSLLLVCLQPLVFALMRGSPVLQQRLRRERSGSTTTTRTHRRALVLVPLARGRRPHTACAYTHVRLNTPVTRTATTTPHLLRAAPARIRLYAVTPAHSGLPACLHSGALATLAHWHPPRATRT